MELHKREPPAAVVGFTACVSQPDVWFVISFLKLMRQLQSLGKRFHLLSFYWNLPGEFVHLSSAPFLFLKSKMSVRLTDQMSLRTHPKASDSVPNLPCPLSP